MTRLELERRRFLPWRSWRRRWPGGRLGPGVSDGCVVMSVDDVIDLFGLVAEGTRVLIT